MKCKRCGAEIQDGHVYCEKCGYEVHIVPDYNIELEEKITKTLERLVKEEINEQKEDEKKITQKKIEKKMYFFASLAGVFLVVAICSIIGAIMLYHGSYEYKFAKGMEAKNQNNYEDAAEYFKEALHKRPDNKELYLYLAEAYKGADKIEEAKQCYQTLLSVDENNIQAYAALLELYEEEEEYEQITELLSKCKNEDIRTAFSDYLISEPVCNLSEDTKKGVLTIEFKSFHQEKIHYTLDGTKVSEQSPVYSEPIVIQSRDITLQAMCVNAKGMKSEILEDTFKTNVKMEEVAVFPVTGVYEKPEWIKVEVPYGSHVYYTYEDRKATQADYEYTGPLRMFIGDSNMNFTMYDETGKEVSSVERSYTLLLRTKYESAEAINAVKNYLVSAGDMLDFDGNIENSTNRYSFRCRYAITIDSRVYLLVDQYLTSEKGKSERVKIYAVDGDDLENINIAERDYNVGYRLKKCS